MKCANFLTGLLLFFSATLIAQPPSENICTEHYCSFSGSSLVNIRGIQQFSSEAEAQAVMTDIVNVMGLRPNFVIQAANVPNAAAWINNTQRYILYNPAFIQSVRASTHTDWSAISILAHEIGHHLQGHTLTRAGSRPATELEADEFSGFVLRKMGANIDEAQAAMRLLASPEGSATHPPRAERLRAIEQGWLRADGLMAGQVPQPQARPYPSQPEVIASTPQEMPAFAQWRVTMVSNPDSQFFITKSNTFVVVKNGKVYTLGEVRSTQSPVYPLVIDLNGSPELRISDRWELIGKNGANVGYLVNK